MCTFFAVSRSGCYAFVHRPGRPEKEAALAERIAQQQECSFRTYGYRRMWLWLKSQNIFRNPKTVLRIMKKYDLLSEIRRRRKWTQMGQRLHKYENLLSRDVHADSPNRRWVTDISYIHTKQGVLYRSMIRDLCDNSIAACKTGTRQTVNLVLDTIRPAMKKEKKRVAAGLGLHSDQGFQYASQAYFNLTQAYGITPSISKRHLYGYHCRKVFYPQNRIYFCHKQSAICKANDIFDQLYPTFAAMSSILPKNEETMPMRRLSA